MTGNAKDKDNEMPTTPIVLTAAELCLASLYE